MIVLDTNVLSELACAVPDPAVLRWAGRGEPAAFVTTAVSEAEILSGIASLPDGRRKDAVATAVATALRDVVGHRVLPFDRAAAPYFAAFVAARRTAGRPLQIADAMIAATALAVGATALATRNTHDFEGCGLALIHPWHDTDPRAPQT